MDNHRLKEQKWVERLWSSTGPRGAGDGRGGSGLWTLWGVRAQGLGKEVLTGSHVSVIRSCGCIEVMIESQYSVANTGASLVEKQKNGEEKDGQKCSVKVRKDLE